MPSRRHSNKISSDDDANDDEGFALVQSQSAKLSKRKYRTKQTSKQAELAEIARDEEVSAVVFEETLAAATAENQHARGGSKTNSNRGERRNGRFERAADWTRKSARKALDQQKQLISLKNYADQLGSQSGTSTTHIWITLSLLVIGLVFAIVSVTLAIHSDWEEIAWGEGLVFRWCGWLSLFTGSIPVIYWMVRILFRSVLVRVVTVDAWYWLRGLQLSFVGMLWSIVNWASIRFVLPTVTSTGDAATSQCNTTDIGLPRAATREGLFLRWMELIFLAVIVVCAFRMVKVVLAKFFVTKAHSGAFWEQIRDSLSLERMLAILGVAGYSETDFEELDLDQSNPETAGAASFWQGVNQVLKQPRIAVREKENLLAYRLASDGPISFAEMDRYEQTLLADAQLATQKIWKKCSAQIPPEPTEAIGKLPVLTEQTLLTCDKFATAFYKPRRRQVMPSDEEECKAQILSWWEKLDAGAHTGPFVALKAKPGDDVAQRYSHLRPDPADHALTFPEVVNILQRMFQKRESLYNTLHDREGISNVLNRTMEVIFWMLMAVIVPIAVGIDLSQLILPMGSFVLGLAFVFGNSLKEAWESILFLFSTRPFNIGDRVTLGVAGEYPSMFVRKIGLLEIEFQATDGRTVMMRTHHVRNGVIVQHARSRDFACDMAIQVSINTPGTVIAEMGRRLQEWAKSDRDQRGVPWQHKGMLFWVNKADPAHNTMTVCLWLELHGITWNQPVYFLPLRGDLWNAWVEICRDLNVTYEQPLQPVRLDSKKANRQIPDKLDEDRNTNKHPPPRFETAVTLDATHSLDIIGASSDDDSSTSTDAS